MASGNFVIGDNLPMHFFSKYIESELTSHGYQVPERIWIPETGLVTSVCGNEDLEEAISQALIKAGPSCSSQKLKLDSVAKLDHYETEDGKVCDPPIGGQGASKKPIYRGVYRVLGVYQDDSTASEMFTLIAKEYYINHLGRRVDQFKEKITDFLNSRFKDF